MTYHQHAAKRAEAGPLNKTVTWSNPNTGHSGTITPIREGRQASTGNLCRQFKQTVIVDGQSQSATSTACRNSDGTWIFQNQGSGIGRLSDALHQMSDQMMMRANPQYGQAQQQMQNQVTVTGQPIPPDGIPVYDASECVGPIVNGICQGTILPNQAVHPICHGQMLNGQCTGPMF